jgi:hypothetical protein
MVVSLIFKNEAASLTFSHSSLIDRITVYQRRPFAVGVNAAS